MNLVLLPPCQNIQLSTRKQLEEICLKYKIQNTEKIQFPLPAKIFTSQEGNSDLSMRAFLIFWTLPSAADLQLNEQNFEGLLFVGVFAASNFHQSFNPQKNVGKI